MTNQMPQQQPVAVPVRHGVAGPGWLDTSFTQKKPHSLLLFKIQKHNQE